MAVVTRLWPYGGPGHPYGDFTGKVEQVIVDEPAPAAAGSSKRKRKYPRWVVIDGKKYRANSPEEERRLLLAAMEAARDVEATGTHPEVEQARKTLKRIRQRLPKVEISRDDWNQRLRDMDEELLLLVA